MFTWFATRNVKVSADLTVGCGLKLFEQDVDAVDEAVSADLTVGCGLKLTFRLRALLVSQSQPTSRSAVD